MRVFSRQILVLCLLVLLGSAVMPLSIALADPPKPPECDLKAEGGDAIPSTFSVNKCLTTGGQTSLVPDDDGSPALENKPSGVVGVLVKAINYLSRIIAAVALLVFIIGALLTVASEGKSDRLEKGKNAMVYSLIGLVIAFMAFIIVAFVQSILY